LKVFYFAHSFPFFCSEFLDPSDKSLAHVVFGAQQLHIYPVAILDVTRSRTEDTEYLLCFNVFGVFVDKYGQRTRPDDIKWSHLPLGFGNILMSHFVTCDSLKKNTVLIRVALN
jgi:citron Rho-interacting kinase